MHELAICQGVVDAVLERTGDARVTTLRLKVSWRSGCDEAGVSVTAGEHLPRIR